MFVEKIFIQPFLSKFHVFPYLCLGNMNPSKWETKTLIPKPFDFLNFFLGQLKKDIFLCGTRILFKLQIV